MRYAGLQLAWVLVLASAAATAQDGAAIYKERCAACHDSPKERIPPLSAVKAMSPATVYTSLTSGSMQSQAQGLTTLELFALMGYIAPSGGSQPDRPIARTCTWNRPYKAGTRDGWNGWGTSVTNSRFADAATAGLTARQLPQLKLKWAFNLGAVTTARAQATVVGDRVFIATTNGEVYSLDANSGCTYWGFKAGSGIRSGVTLGAGRRAAVYFGDDRATLYALDADTGTLIWKVRPAGHFSATVSATPRYYKGVVYQGFSSIEEALAGGPRYDCCTFRGSVVAVDAATGKTIWQSFTIAETPQPTGASTNAGQAHGPSGAGIWSTPTIDEQLHVLYVATGDNYSDPPTATSDAVLAMDLKSGKLLWSKQLTENDAYNVGCATPQQTHCPQAHGPDFDFGQPPILVRLGAGRRALLIAQKSGMAHALDPDRKGQILWQTRVGRGSALGGSQWGSASDGEKFYVAVSDIVIGAVADTKSVAGYRLTVDPKVGGGLRALALRSGGILWSANPVHCTDARTDCSPAQSAAVTVTPGAVFSGSVDGHLRAYSTQSGETLLDFDTAREFNTVNGASAHGGSIDVGGPTVAGGMVFVSSGYGQWGGMPGNVLLALSVDGR